MKIWIFSLISILFISGCSTVPSNPAPHDHKYTVQILEIDMPLKSPLSNWARYGSASIDENIFDPDATVFEYPLMYVEIGIPEILDQTEDVSLVHDFTVEGGKAKTKKETQKLGTTIEITLDEIKNKTASFHIDLHIRKLKGYDTVETAGAKVKIPVMSEKQISTELKYTLNSWIELGSIDGTTHGHNGSFRKTFALKIIPPNPAE